MRCQSETGAGPGGVVVGTRDVLTPDLALEDQSDAQSDQKPGQPAPEPPGSKPSEERSQGLNEHTETHRSNGVAEVRSHFRVEHEPGPGRIHVGNEADRPFGLT